MAAELWDLVFRIKGAGVRRASLGSYEDVGLEEARNRANEITSAARQGQDLIAEEKAKRDEYDRSFTIERLINEYAKRRLTGRLRSAAPTERLIRQTLAPVMARKATDIRRRDLRGLLDEVADRGRLVATEKRRTRVQTMFRWALRQDIVEVDPSAGLSPYSQAVARERVLVGAEIRALWEWLDVGNAPGSGRGPQGAAVPWSSSRRGGRHDGPRNSNEDTSGRLLWRLPAAGARTAERGLTPVLGLALGILEPRLRAAGGDGRLFVPASGKSLNATRVGIGDHPTPRDNADREMGFA